MLENDPVVREELAVWFNEQFKDVEAITWNKKSNRLSKKMMSTVTAILLVSLGLGGYFGLKDHGDAVEDPDVTEANKLIEVLSKAQSPADNKDAITKELKELKFIEDQEDKQKISARMKGKDLKIMARNSEIVFPEEISEMFSSKEGNSINLETSRIVTDLIACKKQIITVAALQDTSYTPFITQDQVDSLKNSIKKHRGLKDDTYKIAIKADKNLESPCGKKLADTLPLEFLIKCDKDWGRKNREDPFWEKAESLLDSCGKVKL